MPGEGREAAEPPAHPSSDSLETTSGSAQNPAKIESSRKPLSKESTSAEGEVLDPAQRKMIIELEARMINIVRREARDPYAGLPADDVLARLDERFPDQHFPERMLSRLEREQSERHARELRQDDLERFVAETDRRNADEDRALVRSWGTRAERVLILLVAVGLLLVFTGHTEIAAIVLGTTLVGVVGAFLAQQLRKK